MPIPWIIGGLVVAAVTAIAMSDEDDSSSSRDYKRELDRDREVAEKKSKEELDRYIVDPEMVSIIRTACLGAILLLIKPRLAA